MSSINKTPNLGLNSWVSTDKPTMEDFNSDNLAIDKKVAVLSKIGAKNWDSGNFKVEKGNWIVNVAGETTAGTATYKDTTGSYYSIGDMVIVSWYLNFIITGATGPLKLTGLPYLNKGIRVAGTHLYGVGITGQEGNTIVPTMATNNNFITMRSVAGGNGANLLAEEHYSTSGVILQGSLVYYK